MGKALLFLFGQYSMFIKPINKLSINSVSDKKKPNDLLLVQYN